MRFCHGTEDKTNLLNINSKCCLVHTNKVDYSEEKQYLIIKINKKLPYDIRNHLLGYLNNEHSRRGQDYVDNENPISKFNCYKFLQYLIQTIDNNSVECNNLVWRWIYHIRRERES